MSELNPALIEQAKKQLETPARFYNWLTSQPRQQTWPCRSEENCVLAAFLRNSVPGPAWSITDDCVWDANSTTKAWDVPQWVHDFIRWFDSYHGSGSVRFRNDILAWLVEWKRKNEEHTA